ncbi:site-specific integrase [Mycobacterium sp. NPDC003449]
MDLKPVRRYLGTRKLQQLTKADGDALVKWMLTEARTDHRHYRAESLAGQVVALVAEHPEGVTAAELAASLPGDVHTALSALLRAGRVTRLRRGGYAPAAEPETAAEKRGLSPQTVRSTLTTFGAVVQSYTDQGVLARNVIALVERPKDADPDERTPAADGQADDSDADTEATAKSWTLAEVVTFREAVRDHRLFACWLLSCYGMRRSEVLGLRWSAVDLDTGTLSVRRGRVAVGSDTVEGGPKSRRSRRDLPLPADVTEALRALKAAQKREALALGVAWSEDRLVAVCQDGEPLRPESYTDKFQRLRSRAGLHRIKLHGLRNTSVSLMLDQGHPPHIVAAWHGHDPAVALSIYADVKADELRAVGASLFG